MKKPNVKEKLAIRSKVNLNNYDSIKVGQLIETSEGEFICKSKPNIYQPIDSRVWVFEQATASDGEPIMGEVLITIA